ncbi:MAG: NAD(P)H-quinone oxidoreductase [Parasphingorhabdus sp.]|uniref:NAD(P)H-quinone oxidoreductase n=1 Tax=Parasphingorhabdus sp. TaxID=2709688 RepID=UPI003002C8E3
MTVTQILQSEMTAIAISKPGGPDVLKPEIMAVPKPAVGEVLIKVVAAGVNRPDIIQRKGLYPAPPGASPLPGLEVSGIVVALGDGVEPEWMGRSICALTNGGGYAEFCVAPVGQCLSVPESLTMEEAAALPETLFTVWSNLFNRGFAREDETVLIHGGTSGIGTMAIKLGKLFGVNVIVTCGSDQKCIAAKTIGADHAINYKTQDFVEEIKKITGGQGVEIVLDMVAGDYVARNLNCLKEDGRHVTIAVQGGVNATLNMAQIMMKRLTLTGSTLRPQSADRKALLGDEIYRYVWPDVEAGKLKPVMDEVFAFRDAAKAHAHMEAGNHIGKIVLTMG